MWWFFAQITRGVAVVDWTLSLSKFTLKNTWEVLNTQFQLFTAEEDIQSFLLEAKGFLKQIKLTAAVGVILPRFHPPFIQRKWVYCFLRIYHGFQETMRKISVFFFSLGLSKHAHLQHVKKSLGPRLDQVRQLLQSCMKFSGGSKVGNILSINFRGEIADLFGKKIPAGCGADPSKTARLANFVKAPGKFAPIFFWETWWKDYCTLQHVFDWVELNQRMSCHKQILEGRCFLSGEVQTFAQFPRYLVESQVFTLYMFPLKSYKKVKVLPISPNKKPSAT